jgi:hypothetical protein
MVQLADHQTIPLVTPKAIGCGLYALPVGRMNAIIILLLFFLLLSPPCFFFLLVFVSPSLFLFVFCIVIFGLPPRRRQCAAEDLRAVPWQSLFLAIWNESEWIIAKIGCDTIFLTFVGANISGNVDDPKR